MNNLAHPTLLSLIIDFFYTGLNTISNLFPEVFANQVPHVAITIAMTTVRFFFLFIPIIYPMMWTGQTCTGQGGSGRQRCSIQKRCLCRGLCRYNQPHGKVWHKPYPLCQDKSALCPVGKDGEVSMWYYDVITTYAVIALGTGTQQVWSLVSRWTLISKVVVCLCLICSPIWFGCTCFQLWCHCWAVCDSLSDSVLWLWKEDKR